MRGTRNHHNAARPVSPLRRALAIGTAWAAFGLAGGAAFARPASTPAAASGAAAAPVAQSADAALVKRGEYLARAGDCIACHPANGGKPVAGGLKFDTPSGGIYSTNNTTDPKAGLGRWPYDARPSAVREVLSKEGG
ncbi:cytochrome c, partial [Burkholderia cenocepacia]